ncbi:MAG: phosphoribosyltransferase family protein [Candidatus Babeliaceae bacterium]|jgi:ComF family protein
MVFNDIPHFLYTTIIDILSPARCASCFIFMKDRLPLCHVCIQKIRPIITSTIKLNKHFQMPVISLSHYEEPIAPLIRAKYYGARHAGKQLAELVWQRTHVASLPCDYIIPVPLHWTRYAARGFNQAAIMADTLAYLSNKPVLNALYRHKKTRYQADLDAVGRAHNLAHSFSLAVSQELLNNKHIILVDDLMTTGATLHNAARILLVAKPASITAVVAARVV